jgi:Tfp pilus assembly protein PilN
MIDLNVLPKQYRRPGVSLRQTLLALGGVAVLAVLGGLFIALSAAQAQTTAQETELAELKAALTNASAVAAQVDPTVLQQTIESLRAETVRLRAEAQTVSSGRPSRAAGIALAIRLVVPGVTLTAITESGGLYQVSGQAGSQASVLDYARALKGRIVSMVNTDPLGLAPEMQFLIEIVQ